MSFVRVTYIEPCRVASFHANNSLTPEEDAYSLFGEWAEGKGLLPERRLIPLIGFNHPWGPEGERRGYELWCVLDNLGDIELSDTIVKEFSGGLYAVNTIVDWTESCRALKRLTRGLKSTQNMRPTILITIGMVSIRLLNTKSYTTRRLGASLKSPYSTTIYQSRRNPDYALHIKKGRELFRMAHFHILSHRFT